MDRALESFAEAAVVAHPCALRRMLQSRYESLPFHRIVVWDRVNGSMLFEQAVTNQHNQQTGITSMLMLSDGVRFRNSASSCVRPVIFTPSAGPDSSVLVTACRDNALKMWAMPTFDKRGILGSRVGHSDCVRCLAKGPGHQTPLVPCVVRI